MNYAINGTRVKLPNFGAATTSNHASITVLIDMRHKSFGARNSVKQDDNPRTDYYIREDSSRVPPASFLYGTPADTPDSVEPTKRDTRAFTEEDLDKINAYLRRGDHYRELMLFVLGVNVGLRYSDLSRLRYADFFNEQGEFKDKITLIEKKTSKRKDPKDPTQRIKRYRYRTIGINEAVRKVVMLNMQSKFCTHKDYLFQSEHTCSLIEDPKPLSNTAMNNIIKNITAAVGIEGNFSTHSLRKTFGYMYMKEHDFDPHALFELQNIFGHHSPQITARYIGLKESDYEAAYQMNIGLEYVTDECPGYAAVSSPLAV